MDGHLRPEELRIELRAVSIEYRREATEEIRSSKEVRQSLGLVDRAEPVFMEADEQELMKKLKNLPFTRVCLIRS
jgi:hypothetical protein